MANTLGQIIGKIVHSFSVKNHAGDTASVQSTFDCSTMSDADVKSALASHLTIRLQRVARMLSVDEIDASYNGVTILASDVGKKIKSRAERIAELVNSGMPDKLATMMIDDPAKFALAMEQLDDIE